MVPATRSGSPATASTAWINDWKRRGWLTADKQPVKNVDLWQRLDAASAGHIVTWQWVRGHSGHPENERADALARAEIAHADGTGQASRAGRGIPR